MPITIPDSPQLTKQAHAAGFATPRDYVLYLIAADIEASEREASGDDDSKENTLASEERAEGSKKFQEGMKRIASLAVHAGKHVDDSRDSIYYDPDEL